MAVLVPARTLLNQALAMFPEDVTWDRLETGSFQSFQGWEPAGYSKVKVPGQKVPGTIYFESDDIAPNGVTGDGWTQVA